MLKLPNYLLAGLPLLMLFVIGCGSSETADPTHIDILEMLDNSQSRHDPVNYVEVDLGSFYVTRENDQQQPLFVRFQLYAVVHKKHESEFTKAFEAHKHTLRDKIREQVLKTETDYLNDPKLDWLQSHLRPLINSTLETQTCRDVIFAMFELEEPFT